MADRRAQNGPSFEHLDIEWPSSHHAKPSARLTYGLELCVPSGNNVRALPKTMGTSGVCVPQGNHSSRASTFRDGPGLTRAITFANHRQRQSTLGRKRRVLPEVT